MRGKRYDAAFKHEAIKKIREDGESASDVSRKLGLHLKTIYRWLEEESQDGEHAFPGKGKLKPADEEMRRLKKENADLREENEILKKAAVIFAKHHK